MSNIDFTVSNITTSGFTINAEISSALTWAKSFAFIVDENRTQWDVESPSSNRETSFIRVVSDLSQGQHKVKVGFDKWEIPSWGGWIYSEEQTIDTRQPSITTVKIDKIGTTGLKITAESSIQSEFNYRLYDSNQTLLIDWTTMNASGSSATQSNSVTITGLNPISQYYVKVKATNPNNGFTTESSFVEAYTAGNAILNSVVAFTVDTATGFNVFLTPYDKTLNYELRIKNAANGNSLLTFPFTVDNTTANQKYTFDFTQSNVNTILSNMPGKTKNFVFELATQKSNGEYFQSVSRLSQTVSTSNVSAPNFGANDISIIDTDEDISELTGSSSVLVQRLSSIGIVVSNIAFQTGATISECSATIGGKKVSSATASIGFGVTEESGTKTLSVTVTDSRGYSKTVNKTIGIVSYQKPDLITNGYFGRINNIEDEIILSFTGSYSLVKVNGIAKNSIEALTYSYKDAENIYANYSSPVSIMGRATISNGNISFSTDANSPLVGLAKNNSYYIKITIKDKFSTTKSYRFLCPKANPGMIFRSGNIGVGTNIPTRKFDVFGDIGMNGCTVQGFKGKLNSSNMSADNCDGGNYLIVASCDVGGLPTEYYDDYYGILEVLEFFMITQNSVSTYFLMQRLTGSNSNGDMCIWIRYGQKTGNTINYSDQSGWQRLTGGS